MNYRNLSLKILIIILFVIVGKIINSDIPLFTAPIFYFLGDWIRKEGGLVEIYLKIMSKILQKN